MLDMICYNNWGKRTNSTKTPDIAGETVKVSFKDRTSMITPTIVYHDSDDFRRVEWTYVQFPQIGAYYFVDDVVSVRQGVWEISMHVDALASYKEYILATKAYVLYADKEYDTMLSDSRYIADSDAKCLVSRTTLTGMDAKGTTILLCMSDTATSSVLGGLATAYSVNAANISLIRDGLKNLYDNEELSEQIKRAYNSPFDAFLSAYWIPFGSTAFGGASERIVVGGYQFGNGYTVSVPSVDIDQVITIPHAYADFRAAEPFSAYYLRLPCVGTVTLPSDICARTTAISITGKYDYMGNISYNLRSKEDGTFASFGGNASIQLPISVAATGNGMGVVQGISEATGGVLQTIGGLVQTSLAIGSGSPVAAQGTVAGVGSMAAGVGSTALGVMNAVNAYNSKTYMSRGTLSGGAAGADNYIDAVCAYHETPTSGLAGVLGRPVMSVKNLSGLTGGYVQTSGASVDCPAESSVRDTINKMLDGGVYLE